MNRLKLCHINEYIILKILYKIERKIMHWNEFNLKINGFLQNIKRQYV